MKRHQLQGRVALITGAASGIGEALAECLAAAGARLLLLDINAARLELLAARLGARGWVCDVRDEAALARVAEQARAEFGALDFLFVNAGVATVGAAVETPAEDVRWVFEINVLGSLAVVRHFAPSMIAAGRGRIVFTASIAGLIGAPGMSVYSASKFALVGFAESLRVELEGTGVTVTTVCPGRVETGLHGATRYRNDGFERFLGAPSRLSLTADTVARRSIDAAVAGAPMVVLGPERIAVWLRGVSLRAYTRVASRASRALGLLGRERGRRHAG